MLFRSPGIACSVALNLSRSGDYSMLSAAPASTQKNVASRMDLSERRCENKQESARFRRLFASACFVWNTLIIASVVLNALCFSAGV